jgi:exodeoxyribonuclease VII small subunit
VEEQSGRDEKRCALRTGCGGNLTLDAQVALPYVLPVPSAPKNSGRDNDVQADGLPFEEALKKLEAIVTTMESEDLPLESLLARYEEGTRLAKTCQKKLAEAEVKIRQLEKTAAGEMQLKPLPSSEGAEE